MLNVNGEVVYSAGLTKEEKQKKLNDIGYKGEFVNNAMDAIRKKCVDCYCGHLKEIKSCPSDKCPLWPFRLKKNPFSTRGKNGNEVGSESESEGECENEGENDGEDMNEGESEGEGESEELG